MIADAVKSAAGAVDQRTQRRAMSGELVHIAVAHPRPEWEPLPSPGVSRERRRTAMTTPPTRIVTLVLVTADGDVLGRLPAFPADTPWWQDAGPVVREARQRFGLDVTILRLPESELPSAHGGAVTYLAEVGRATLAGAPRLPELDPWNGVLTEDPLRQPFARPGGPAADLAWADSVLAARSIARSGPAEQIRTWNLSSLWRLPTNDGIAWLKVVPPFFAHEGQLLERLAGEAVPSILGRDSGRMLLAEIPGEDQYDAPLPELLEMIDILVDLQRQWQGRTDTCSRRSSLTGELPSFRQPSPRSSSAPGPSWSRPIAPSWTGSSPASRPVSRRSMPVGYRTGWSWGFPPRKRPG